jgi:glycosyltransferase involved in cell wall biosynthesis
MAPGPEPRTEAAALNQLEHRTGTPDVTVVIPHYQCERFLRRAVCSILSQQGVNLELWLVDDHSTGRAWLDALKGLTKDRRLVLYQTSCNVGHYRIKNALLPWIRSPYVAFQDADDFSDHLRLRTQLDEMGRSGAGIVGCSFRYISESGATISARKMVRRCNLWLRVGKAFVLLHPTTIVRREVFEDIGGFDGTARIGADDDFMLRAAMLYRIRNVRSILYAYRQRGDSLTGSPITGHGSRMRAAYSEAVWQRAATRRRLRSRQELVESLQVPRNDIEFELRRVPT